MEKKKKETTVIRDEYNERVKPYLEKMIDYVSHGCTEKDVYEAYGIGKTTWFRYKKEHPELKELLYKAKKFAEIELVNLAYKLAKGYFVEERTEKTIQTDEGEQTIVTIKNKYIKPEADILKFLLINRYPEDWQNDPTATDLRKEMMELKKKEDGYIGI